MQNLTPQITHTFSHRSLLQWGIQKLEKFHRFNDKLEYTCMCIRFNDKLEYTEARKIPRFPNARSSEPVPRDSVLGGGIRISGTGYLISGLKQQRGDTTGGDTHGAGEPWLSPGVLQRGDTTVREKNNGEMIQNEKCHFYNFNTF